MRRRGWSRRRRVDGRDRKSLTRLRLRELARTCYSSRSTTNSIIVVIVVVATAAACARFSVMCCDVQANSAAVESTGQAKAEAQSRAEAARIEGEAAVEQAKLKAEAMRIEAVSFTSVFVASI